MYSKFKVFKLESNIKTSLQMLLLVMIIVLRNLVIWKWMILMMPPIVVKLLFLISTLVISQNLVLSVCVSLVVVFVNIDLRIHECVKSVKIIVSLIYRVLSLSVNARKMLLLKKCSCKV